MARACWAIDTVDHPGGGAQITVVAPNGPAAAAGLVPGDVVTAVSNDGFTQGIHNAADLAASLDQLMDGDPATLTTLHGDGRADRQVSLGDRDWPPRPLAGLAAELGVLVPADDREQPDLLAQGRTATMGSP